MPEGSHVEQQPDEIFETNQKEAGLYYSEVERAKKNWGIIFDEYNNGQDRVNELLKRLQNTLRAPGVNGDEIKQDLEKLALVDNKEGFVDGATVALKPIIDLANKSPKEFERMQREVQDMGENVRINEVLFYGMHGDWVDIHVSASKTLGGPKIKSLFVEGLKELAKVVAVNDLVQKVEADSWIIAEKPKLIEKLGFEVIHINEKEGIGHAKISRENFLKRYLEK